MGTIVVRRKTIGELYAEYRAEKLNYDAIKVAVCDIRDGAQSATVSTAGGSQSYTKATLADLEKLWSMSAKKLNSLLAKIAHLKNDPNRPRRASVTFGD